MGELGLEPGRKQRMVERNRSQKGLHRRQFPFREPAEGPMDGDKTSPALSHDRVLTELKASLAKVSAESRESGRRLQHQMPNSQGLEIGTFENLDDLSGSEPGQHGRIDLAGAIRPETRANPELDRRRPRFKALARGLDRSERPVASDGPFDPSGPEQSFGQERVICTNIGNPGRLGHSLGEGGKTGPESELGPWGGHR